MSDLRLVDRPVLVPGRCMFTGGNGPCVDFLRDFDLDHDGRIYIGVDFAREIGRFVGLVDPPEDVSDDGGELDALRAELVELRRLRESVLYTFNNLGVEVKKKPGRPRKEV